MIPRDILELAGETIGREFATAGRFDLDWTKFNAERASSNASRHSSKGDHESAQQSHREAKDEHMTAAREAKDSGDKVAAKAHASAAVSHEHAERMHERAKDGSPYRVEKAHAASQHAHQVTTSTRSVSTSPRAAETRAEIAQAAKEPGPRGGLDAATKMALGEATAKYDDAKASGNETAMAKTTATIATHMSNVYRTPGGDMKSAAASVVGWAATGGISKSVVAKAEKVYRNDLGELDQRVKDAEAAAVTAAKNGDAHSVVKTMLIAHQYREVANGIRAQGSSARPLPAINPFDKTADPKARAAAAASALRKAGTSTPERREIYDTLQAVTRGQKDAKTLDKVLAYNKDTIRAALKPAAAAPKENIADVIARNNARVESAMRAAGVTPPRPGKASSFISKSQMRKIQSALKRG